VQSADDAIATFVTTDLDALFIGDTWIRRADSLWDALGSAQIAMTPFCVLSRQTHRRGRSVSMYRTAFPNQLYPVGEEIAALVESGRPATELGLAVAPGSSLAEEIWELWSRRLITVSPG